MFRRAFLSIFYAAVICEDPRLIGFAVECHFGRESAAGIDESRGVPAPAGRGAPR